MRNVRLPQIAVEALRKQFAVLMREGWAGRPIVFPDVDGQFMQKSNFECPT